MKAHFVRGHNPAPILGKGCAHEVKNEYIPDLDFEIDDYYFYLEMEKEMGDDKSPEAFIIRFLRCVHARVQLPSLEAQVPHLLFELI